MRTAKIARASAAVAGAAVLAACSIGDGATPAPAPAPTVAAPAAGSTAPSSPSERTEPAPDLSAPETVATGLTTPWGLAFLPDGSALVAERDTGHILQVRRGGGAPREVYRVPGVEAGGEGGLLGIAVARDFASTALVYAYFTSSSDNRIVRFRLGQGGAPQVIFDGLTRGGRHNGGRLAFGPDGMLYVGTGDAGDTSQAQDRDDPNGKILRLTPDGEPALGNPTAGSPIWTLGHRNVQGLAWDAEGRMYATEFGQDRFDEVNLIERGHNYGWPEVEGTGGRRGYTDPIISWRTSEASPSGAAIVGRTLYAAGLRGERLWLVPLDGGTARAEFRGRYGRLRTVAVAPDGALWLTTSNTDGRGNERDGDDRILRFPANGPVS